MEVNKFIALSLSLNMTRRLRRKAKDLVCMRQLAQCGYCARQLCDAFEVDHLNERRTDDREQNLVATCALCHAIKSRHVRLNRDWSYLKESLRLHLEQYRERWQEENCWDRLPRWLQVRLDYCDARVYYLTVCMNSERCLDLSHYRRQPKPVVRPGIK